MGYVPPPRCHHAILLPLLLPPGVPIRWAGPGPAHPGRIPHVRVLRSGAHSCGGVQRLHHATLARSEWRVGGGVVVVAVAAVWWRQIEVDTAPEEGARLGHSAGVEK
jgi:hypothetical protein